MAMVKRRPKARFLMIQGTASHVGKSRIVAALCRIFANRGLRVAPFKAQNMALNSAVTSDSGEIGRSTAEQARAARIEPRVEMNPLLLKPKSDSVAQLMVMGQPYGDFSAADNFKVAEKLTRFKRQIVKEALRVLAAEFEVIIIEGAGSPAEVNLRPYDVVNMAVASLVHAPVLLVADIDKGGALASLVGTMVLLTPDEKSLVKGLILNKFRGDETILKSALSFLHRETGVQVLGVIPFYKDLDQLAEEDALPENAMGDSNPEIDIAIVYHPHLANFTDFSPLAMEPRVRIRYVRSPRSLGNPDAILLPGTKNTSHDLKAMMETGLAGQIQAQAQLGTPVIGICGGYQMMGQRLFDPNRLESDQKELTGLRLLDSVTTFQADKRINLVRARPIGGMPFLAERDYKVEGYEIRHGSTKKRPGLRPAFQVFTAGDGKKPEGAVSRNGLIFGTYLHDLFTHNRFRRDFVNALRTRKGLSPLGHPIVDIQQQTEDAIERWAAVVKQHLDTDSLMAMMDKSYV